MAKVVKVSLSEKRRILIHHALDNGWLANSNYIDEQEKAKGSGETFELDALILGKYLNDFHLISNCGNYTLRVTKTKACFWRMKPKWATITKSAIGDIELTNEGFRFLGIVNIVLPKNTDEVKFDNSST